MQRRRSAPVSSVLSRNTFRMKDTLRIMDLHDAGEASCSAPKAMRHVDSSHTVMDALVDSSIESKVETPANTDLIGLPADIILFIGERCAEADILALTLACHALHETVEASSSLWEAKIRRRHASVIDSLFGGIVPAPLAGRSWKAHAYEFDREWLNHARQRSGRLLLRMSSNCALCRPHDDVDPMYLGVPPSPRPYWYHLHIFDLFVLPIRLDLFGLSGADRFGVYDATDFVDRHPGAEYLLYQAGSEMDCTQGFDAANHSEHARRILRRLVVPGLEELAQPPPLVRPRPSALARAVDSMRERLREWRRLPAQLWHAAVMRSVVSMAGRASVCVSVSEAKRA